MLVRTVLVERDGVSNEDNKVDMGIPVPVSSTATILSSMVILTFGLLSSMLVEFHISGWPTNGKLSFMSKTSGTKAKRVIWLLNRSMLCCENLSFSAKISTRVPV